MAEPRMRGDELARRLRQANPSVKILYFTGFSDWLFKVSTRASAGIVEIKLMRSLS